MTSPAAPSKNLHHTTQGWRSLEEYYWEYKWDTGEAEYFAHVEPTNTHDYPLTLQTATIVGNESDDQELPF